MKTGPKGPRPNSAATLLRSLILQGLSDGEIVRRLQKKLPSVRKLVKWHRWRMRKNAAIIQEILR